MRVVSLTCSNTEIVCALGCADLLVGVDDHSDHPPEVVRRLPRVGPDLSVDVEKVAALEPDLVLASLTVPGHEKVVAELEAAGLELLAPAPTSVADVLGDIREIARHLDGPGRAVRSRAEEIAAAMERELLAPARETRGHRPRLLVQWWPKPVIAPGRLSWAHDLIEAAGGENPLGEEAVESRPLTDDEVRHLAPDAVVVSWCGVDPAKYRPDVVYRNEAFTGLPFVERGRVFCVPEAFLGRPAPRLVEGRRALARIVEAVREEA